MNRLLALCTVTTLGDSNFMPAPECVFTTTGYDLKKGCKPSAIEIPPKCAGAMVASAACLQSSSVSSGSTTYTRKVEDHSDYSSLLKSVTDAEGGGFGVTVGTGVSVATTSSMSECSIAFYIGASELVHEEVVVNPVKLQLTGAALAKLKADPMGFLTEYGPHYVYKVTFGGSFMGYFTLTEKSSSSTTDVDVFASFSENIFMHASASEDFESKVSSSSSHVKQVSSVSFKGGSAKTDTSSPAALGKMFSEWEDTMRSAPKAVKMTLRSWLDLEQVQEVVNKASPEVQKAFNADPIVTNTMEVVTRESGDTSFLMSSVEASLTWPEVTSNATANKLFRDLGDKVSSHRGNIQTMGEAELLLRQAEIGKGDFTWFTAETMSDEFERMKSQVTTRTTTTTTTLGPTTQLCEYRWNKDEWKSYIAPCGDPNPPITDFRFFVWGFKATTCPQPLHKYYAYRWNKDDWHTFLTSNQDQNPKVLDFTFCAFDHDNGMSKFGAYRWGKDQWYTWLADYDDQNPPVKDFSFWAIHSHGENTHMAPIVV